MIQRKGRATKAQMIRKALERAHTKEEAYIILDCSQFKLLPIEIDEIVEDWNKIQIMLKVHGKGVYATPLEAVV